MKSEFSSVLTTLRRERRLSQKKVADDLGVSQALLSHYENGVREPKLEFIIKACQYYRVTTDYILGLTDTRSFEGVVLKCGSASGQYNAGAAALVVSVLSELGDEALEVSAAGFMDFAIYTLFSALRPGRQPYEPLFDAALKAAEAEFVLNARRVGAEADVREKLTDDALWGKYPEQFDAMLQVEENTQKAVARLKKATKKG